MLFVAEIGLSFALLLVKPLIGWQNNWDFIRLSSCSGIWQSADGQALRTAWPVPTSQFLYNEETAVNFCQPSSDLLFTNILKIFVNPGTYIDISALGFIRLLFLFVALAALFFLSRERNFKLTIVISTFLTICSYPYVAYLNSMYADSTALSFALLSVLCLLLFLTEPHSRKTSLIWLMFLTIGLGLSKVQYLPLAISILVITVLFAAVFKSKFSIFVSLTSIIMLLTLSNMTTTARNMTDATNTANRADTILGAVLPEVANPDAALVKLGLPSACKEAIGSDWYTPGFQDTNPCPEISLVTSTAILKLVPSEPLALFNVFSNGVKLSQPFSPEGRLLWIDAEANNAVVLSQIAKIVSPLPLIFNTLSSSAWTITIWVSIAFVPAVGLIVLLIPKVRRKIGILAPSLLISSGILTTYAIATSVFGDGYIEVDKHSSLGIISFPLFISGLIVIIVMSTRRRSNHDNDLITYEDDLQLS